MREGSHASSERVVRAVDKAHDVNERRDESNE